MALLELCGLPLLSCSRLVVCLDRRITPHLMDVVTKDLGWIGFGLATLRGWTAGSHLTSRDWLFMDMDV